MCDGVVLRYSGLFALRIGFRYQNESGLNCELTGYGGNVKFGENDFTLKLRL